jgi:3-hydroxyisobutyrate dehydrogenase-like beta-hydroxyacid dehydrogenase
VNTLQTTTLGFVGLGHMGGNMAARLFAAGYTVYGTSRTRGHTQALEDAGLRWYETPRAVAEAADILFTSLPDGEAVERVAAGPDGAIAGLTAP